MKKREQTDNHDAHVVVEFIVSASVRLDWHTSIKDVVNLFCSHGYVSPAARKQMVKVCMALVRLNRVS